MKLDISQSVSNISSQELIGENSLSTTPRTTENHRDSANRTLPSPASPMPNDILELLTTLPIFKSVENEDGFFDSLASTLQMRKVHPGDIVIRQGELAKVMFLIVRGILLIISDDGEIEFAELTRGSYFGEIGILFDMKRTATVVAKTICTLLTINADDLKSLNHKYPQFEKSMKSAAEGRLNLLTKEYTNNGKVIPEEIQVHLEAFRSDAESEARLGNLRSIAYPESTAKLLIEDTTDDDKSSGSDSEYEAPEIHRPLSAVSALNQRMNEKRRASVAVWSDEKLMNFAKNIATARTKESRMGDALARSQVLFRQDSAMMESREVLNSQKEQILNSFPISIVLKILKFLKLQDLLKLRRASVFFKSLIMDRTNMLLTNISLSEFKKIVTDSVLNNFISIHGKGIQSLNISSCWLVTNSGLQSIAVNCPALTLLDLSSVWDITDAGLITLARSSFLYLAYIDLSNCRKITDKGVLELLDHAELLQFINLDYCKNLTGAILNHARWGTMNVLSIQRCTSIKDDGFKNWKMDSSVIVDSKSWELEDLNLSDCSFLGDSTIEIISTRAPNLRRLTLSFCCSLTSNIAESLVAGCPFLETLDVSYCGNAVTDEFLKNIALGLPYLKNLNIRGCVQVTDAGIMEISTHAAKLESLNMSQCQKISPSVEKESATKWKPFKIQKFSDKYR